MPVAEISCAELAERLKAPAPPVLLDVRGPDEHAIAALPGSVLIPLHELGVREDEVEALAGKEVVVYCHLGVRSLHGAAFLASKGIDAKSLRGGIDRWSIEVDPAVARY